MDKRSLGVSPAPKKHIKQTMFLTPFYKKRKKDLAFLPNEFLQEIFYIYSSQLVDFSFFLLVLLVAKKETATKRAVICTHADKKKIFFVFLYMCIIISFGIVIILIVNVFFAEFNCCSQMRDDGSSLGMGRFFGNKRVYEVVFRKFSPPKKQIFSDSL